ncbi:bacterial leucyl aminopeptidase [Malassezia vespertilionis]|nr:bacterial leucyl aminopeptidase [Malassezia vespertilionis]WFD05063.1 bacterial leucyl aminopeptidase [Malassezia vespertilionis]
MHHQSELMAAFLQLCAKQLRKHLEKLTSFYTRHYRSASGKASALWISKVLEEMLAPIPYASVRTFDHPWLQPSILVHFQGTNASLTETRGVTLLGAHIDSANMLPFLRAPGADDDGSGTVTLLETIRVLLAAQWRPESDVEFHFYAAEEGGLLGSQAVAQSYARRHVLVRAMLQQDMTAYVAPGTSEHIGLVEDYVSAPLTNYLEQLAKVYLTIPAVRTQAGYAASDHASWNKTGYPSAFAIESAFASVNLGRAHTTKDIYSAPGFSFAHMLQFARLAAAFAAELGGWARSPDQ